MKGPFVDPYDLDSFFVKPTDVKGHGEKMSARVPPDLARVVDVIISSKKFPYKASGDFIRDAVWRLASLLSPLVDSYEGTTIMARLSIMEEILKPVKAGESLIKEIEDLGLRLLSLDNLSQKKKLVKAIKENLEAVSSDYWRDRSLRLLEGKYGEYLT